jgi:hypothetical protein
VAVAENVTAAPAAEVAVVVRFPGEVMIGGVVSTTVMVKLVVATLPAESVAFSDTVETPTGKTLPEA